MKQMLIIYEESTTEEKVRWLQCLQRNSKSKLHYLTKYSINFEELIWPHFPLLHKWLQDYNLSYSLKVWHKT